MIQNGYIVISMLIILIFTKFVNNFLENKDKIRVKGQAKRDAVGQPLTRAV